MSVILFGTTATRHAAGWVADFCPICQTVRAHRVTRVGSAFHAWWIPLGDGALTGHEVTCSVCHAIRTRDVDEFDSVAEEEGTSLEALERETFPLVRSRFARELELAARPRSLTRDQRREAIRERLVVLGDQLEHERANSTLSARGKNVAYAGIAIFVVWLVFAFGSYGMGLIVWEIGTLIRLMMLFCAILILTVTYCMLESHPSFMANRFRPQLRRALQPLDPSLEELRAVLAELDSEGLPLTKKYGSEKLYGWIAEEFYAPAE